MLEVLEPGVAAALGRLPGLSEAGDYAMQGTGPTGKAFNFSDASTEPAVSKGTSESVKLLTDLSRQHGLIADVIRKCPQCGVREG